MDILTILILSVLEHGISFCLFVCSSVSFIEVLYENFKCTVFRSFTSLVKFIPGYFFPPGIFYAVVNGIIFLISLSGSLLLVASLIVGKESACNAGDPGSIPGLGRSAGEGIGYPLQYSGLENSMDGIVHGVAKSQM